MSRIYFAHLLTVALFVGLMSDVLATEPIGQPVELGKVTWLRDFDAGLERSKAEDKPIFLLFQEVPGCGTCQRYGQDVLSHPLIVDAIETLFVPVAIFNNKGGADRKVLEYYKEPAWNNPVLRIVGAGKQDVVPRVAGNYSVQAVVQAMYLALVNTYQDIPPYLELLNAELNPTEPVETTFVSMYCFWSGEQKIGKINGVLESQPGFMNGREVVKVKFDPAQTDRDAIVKASSADLVKQPTAFRVDGEPKYYLSKTNYRYVPMTQLQAARVNSAIGEGASPNKFLSPRQLALLNSIEKNPKAKWKSCINVTLMNAWKKLPTV